jgi:pyroglutamyl-peptidase
MKLLLTAFDPFGGEKVNPAQEAVKLVSSKIGKVEVVKLTVPTVFGKSIDRVVKAMKKEKPDVVLCIGQAGGRFDVTPERVAINVDDARIKDNEGNQPIGPIYEDGENAYFATLPIKAMVQKIREAGVPSSVSNSAGTFVCNHLMYGVLYHISKSFPSMLGGFIHVPFIPSQVVDRPAPSPCLALTDITRALEEAIKAIGESSNKKSGKDLETHEGKEF